MGYQEQPKGGDRKPQQNGTRRPDNSYASVNAKVSGPYNRGTAQRPEVNNTSVKPR